jgi:RNA polymerase sigma factor (sigma-70 family)
MTTLEDSELLRRYAADQSEAAFAELVRRHLPAVYPCAVRQVGGDTHLAEDVAQMVFTTLARKASSLRERQTIGGWLYRTTHFAARDVVRVERRRRAREQEAQTMNESMIGPEPAIDWERLHPVLDETLNELSDDDRDAVWLRFFEGRSFVEVGTKLRLTENAARMRVERALDKLHGLLARRGITSTTAALGVVLGSQATVAAPAGLAASIAGAALSGTAAAGAINGAVLFMGMTKLQIGIASALAIAGGASYFAQANTNAELRREIAALRERPSAISALRAENKALANTAAEIEMLRHDAVELQRLAQRGAEARTEMEDRARRAVLAKAEADEARARQMALAAELSELSAKEVQLRSGFRRKDPDEKAPPEEFSLVQRRRAEVTDQMRKGDIQHANGAPPPLQVAPGRGGAGGFSGSETAIRETEFAEEPQQK